MQTMQPVLLYGQYEWDRNWLPPDEFEARLADLRRVMSDKGWKWVVVHGDSQENGLLCYLTNFIPNQRWGLALFGMERPPRLVVPVGSRDLPAVRKLTWIQDIRATGDISDAIGSWLREGFDRNDVSTGLGKIGFAEVGRMRFDVAEKALEACRNFSAVEDATSALTAITHVKRSREIALLRLSYQCLQVLLREVLRVRSNGGDKKTALLAGERSARMAGAQDVRMLCSVDKTGALQPIESHSPAPLRAGSSEPWPVYLAVRKGGYWAEAMLTITDAPSAGQRAARRAIEKAAASVCAGITCRDFFCRVEEYRPSSVIHSLLGGGVCRAGGLSLDGEYWMHADSEEVFVANGVYTIAITSCDGETNQELLSTTILVRTAGHEILWPTDSEANAY